MPGNYWMSFIAVAAKKLALTQERPVAKNILAIAKSQNPAKCGV
jgi:hypothetical protein